MKGPCSGYIVTFITDKDLYCTKQMKVVIIAQNKVLT